LLSREASNAAAKACHFTKGYWKDPREIAGRTDTDHFKLMAGWCALPDGKSTGMQMWTFDVDDAADHVLPPGFDLNRYVTHVNRGITHFHASFWPLPRNISDAALESAVAPEEWSGYTNRHHELLSGLKGGQNILGLIHADGRREPVYKSSSGGHFRRCAPGETDTKGPAEFVKPLIDPSRMTRMISGHLEAFERGALNYDLLRGINLLIRAQSNA
jgi:hypothetical protein